MKSIVRENSEKDPTYCPYCMRCPGLVRMVKVGEFKWKCDKCGASHEELVTYVEAEPYDNQKH